MEGTPRAAGGSLLERDREVAALDRLVAAVAEGESGIVVVEGRAGIGKSRLMLATRERATAAGLRSLSARGTELERDFPFGAVRQLFEPLRADPEQWERALAGAAGAARSVFDAPVSDDGAAPADTSFGALHGLYWLTANLAAEGPLVLLIDDLHWCDRPSLRFLAYLAPRLEGLPVLVVTGVRTGEAGADPALLADLLTTPTTIVVSPGPLSGGAVRGLVAERLGADPDERFVEAVEEATGGNPLLLRQLINSLESEGVRPVDDQAEMVRAIGPRAVSRSILLRLARLDDSATSTAYAVAVLGDSAELPLVARLAGLDEPTAAAATAALARADILRPESPLGFAHPLIRDAVYRDLAPAERELRHADAAQLLIDAGAGDDQIATQLLQAPHRGDRAIVDVLRRASRSAVQRGAADSAVAYLRRALDEPPPDDLRPYVLLELAEVQERTSGPAALENLQAAYDGVDDPSQRARLAFQIGFLLLFTGAPHESRPVLERAMAELEPGGEARLMLEALHLGLVWFGVGDAGELDRLVPWRTPAGGTGFGSLMTTAYAAFDWAIRCGPARECSDLVLEAAPLGHYNPIDVGITPAAIGVVLTLAERDEVEAHWASHAAAARNHGSVFGSLSAHVWRAWTLQFEGALQDAEAEMLRGREAQSLWGAVTRAGTGQAAGVLATILIEQGRVDEARGVLAMEPRDEAATFGGLFRDRAEVEMLLADRRHDDALAVALELAGKVDGWMDNPALVPWYGFAALALDALGRTAEALPLVERELEQARSFGAPAAIGRALRVRGTLLREDGLADLEAAVDVLSGSRARLEYAKALAALGSAQRRARQPTESREPLRRALELASACGADGLASQVRSELAAAGVKPRTTALGGVESLTASERRVTSLAAEGRTNRDIAQELFVTPKTVEVHLSNAYRKLGIRSRRELAGALTGAAA